MQVMGDQKQLACARDPWSANVNLFTLRIASIGGEEIAGKRRFPALGARTGKKI